LGKRGGGVEDDFGSEATGHLPYVEVGAAIQINNQVYNLRHATENRTNSKKQISVTCHAAG